MLLIINNTLLAQFDNTKETEPINSEKEKKVRNKNNISESFEYIQQVNNNDSILKFHKKYNKNGDVITNTEFSAKLDTINYAAYEYSGEKLVKSHLFNKNKNIRISNDIRTYFYDEKGNNNEIQHIKKDGEIIYQKIDYNNNNLKKSLKTKWLNQTQYYLSAEYFYSKNNTSITEKRYWPIGKLFCEVKYTYDKLGNLTNSYRLQNGKKDIISIYLYDEANNQIESNLQILDGKKPSFYSTKFEYDSANNIIRKLHSVDNVLKSIHTISYKKFE